MNCNVVRTFVVCCKCFEIPVVTKKLFTSLQKLKIAFPEQIL